MTVYAISPIDVADGSRGQYITAGKAYPVYEDTGIGFQIEGDDDGRPVYCLWKGCAHLGYRDWQRVEEPDAPAADFRSMSDRELADWAVGNGLADGCAEEIAGRFVTENIKTTTGSRDFRDYFTNKENPNHA